MVIALEKDDLDEGSSVAKQAAAGAVAETVKETTPPPATPSATPPATPPVTSTAAPTSTPPATSPVTQQVAKPEEVENAVLEEIFGKKADGKPYTKTEARELVKKWPDAVSTYESQLASAPKFANDYVRGLNDYLSKGGTKEVYDRVQALDLEKLNGIEAIRAKYKWDHPELSDAQIERKLQKQYSLSEDATPDDKEDGQIDIAIDSKKAKEELIKIKQEKSIPEPERLREQEEKAEADRVAALSPVAKSLVKDLVEFAVPMAFDDKGNVTDTLKFSGITDELRKELEDDMHRIVERSDLPYSQESIATLQEVLKNQFVIRAFPNLIKSALTEQETRLTKKFLEEYHNNGTLPKGDQSPAPTTKSAEDTLFDVQMARLTGGK